jgi:hypothetical protein
VVPAQERESAVVALHPLSIHLLSFLLSETPS